MKTKDLEGLWSLLSAAYPSMEALTPDIAKNWMEFIGWADFDVMRQAVVKYINEERYKPTPSQLRKYYYQISSEIKTNAAQKQGNQNCPYCRGTGWVIIHDDNDLYPDTATPCKCRTLPPIKPHNIINGTKEEWEWPAVDDYIKSPSWAWNQNESQFERNRKWIGDLPEVG